MIKKQNKLGTYLAVTAGVGCAASVANGAVTFFGPGAQSPDSNPATPVGLSFGSLGNGTGYLNGNGSYFTRFARDITGYFTRGSDIDSIAGAMLALYSSGLSGASAGAVLGSDQNYANISFDSNISVFEGVGQFFLDGDGGGFLVALAVNDDGSALSISDGVALIEAASVPEPSSLALLALGAAGLTARRQRKKAA